MMKLIVLFRAASQLSCNVLYQHTEEKNTGGDVGITFKVANEVAVFELVEFAISNKAAEETAK